MDTCCTPGRLFATETAWKRSLNELLAASTSTIFADGAIACAHSMSSAASRAQPQLLRGWRPFAYTTWKTAFVFARALVDGSVRRPNALEKVLKSLNAVP